MATRTPPGAMSARDYAAVLADLRQRRDELAAAIAAIEPLCGKTPPSVAAPSPATRPRWPTAPKRKPGRKPGRPRKTQNLMEPKPARVDRAAIDAVVAEDKARRRGPWRECVYCHKWRRGEQGPCVHCGKEPKVA